MLFNIKIAAAGALAVGAIGLWVPKMLSGDAPAVDDYEVDPDDPTGGAFVDGFDEDESMDEPLGMGAPDPLAAPAPGPTPSTEASIGAQPALAEPSAALDTREVLELVAQLRGGASPRQPVESPRATTLGDPVLPDAVGTVPLGLLAPNFDLEGFRQEHALTGVLVGKASCAVLGDEIVLEGQAFAGGRARLISVGPNEALVEVDGEPMRFSLPPFKPAAPENTPDDIDPGV